MLAVIPVRDGLLPAGGAETVCECGGRAVLVGSGTLEAAASLTGQLRCLEIGVFQPAMWTDELVAVLADESIVVMPSSADGRDLAPRLAAALDRPLFAGAIRATVRDVVVAVDGGLRMRTLDAPARYIATLQPGVRGTDPATPDMVAGTTVTTMRRAVDAKAGGAAATRDATVVEVIEPDAASIDLSEAVRIVGGGAGLDGESRFTELAELGGLLGASVGATRVITDRGWVGHERQIGTTGVVVDPELYLAFGISGAVQHTSGLGQPAHIISVNVDAYCPMMQLADLAVVADANLVLHELIDLLGTQPVPSEAESA